MSGGRQNRPSFSLFDTEEEVLRQSEGMLGKLDEVAGGVRALADAYRTGYREQRRLVRLSDRMQLDLQTANQELARHADALADLNRQLQAEIEVRRRLEDELRVLASTDELTGAASRRHLFELARHEIDRRDRTGAPLSLLLIDLDQFKAVNDSRGHAAGDEALRRFASTCREQLRRGDVFARAGGEEFALLLPATTSTAATDVAERIRAAVAAIPIECDGQRFSITVSIGVSQVAGGETTLDRALSRADKALYAAKRSGRNRVSQVGTSGDAAADDAS